MVGTTPAPYKLVIVQIIENFWGGAREQEIIDIDASGDPISGGARVACGMVGFSQFGLEYWRGIKEVIDGINNREEIRDTGYKYYLSSWYREESYPSNRRYCISLKATRTEMEVVCPTKFGDSLPASLGIDTPISSAMSDCCLNDQVPALPLD